MCARRRLGFESLESRQMLSASAGMSNFLASQTAVTIDDVPPLVAANVLSQRQFMASEQSASRWDWLAGTQWYVKQENLLSYEMPLDLSERVPVVDETLWFIHQSSGGKFSGQAVATLDDGDEFTREMEGTISSNGQIRIEFLDLEFNGTATTGVGQMRFVNGAWRMEMQMATGVSSLLSHWAYMTQYTPGTILPEPILPPDSNLLSTEWQWLTGSTWAIRDTMLFGGQTQAGVFHIDGFRGGYYWGSGTTPEPFNVFGSVTPEGNLLLLVSVNGADAVSRNGILYGTSSGATMKFHSYDGSPGAGSARLLTDLSPGGLNGFLASSLGS